MASMVICFLSAFVVFCSASNGLNNVISLNAILERLNSLERTVADQNNEITQLKDNESLLLHRINSLELESSKDIYSTYKDFGNKKSEDPSDDSAEMNEKSPEEDLILRAKQIKRVPTKRATTAVAFYAYMTKSEPHPGQHHVLEFDHIVTNVGSGLNKFTGIFTVPVSGIYVLTATLSGSPSSEIPLEFIRNNDELGQIQLFSASSTVDTNPTVSTTIVVQLTMGDSIFLRTSQAYTAAGGIYSSDLSRSSFAGWLLPY